MQPHGEPRSLMETLLTDGVVVFPALSDFSLWKANSEIEAALLNFNEVAHHTEYSQKPALAVFGAIDTASSFHHPAVRNIRILAADAIRKNFRQFYNSQGMELYNMQLLMDRLGVRVPKSDKWGGGEIGGESWHRDVAPEKYLSLNDEVLGGWINLNSNVTQAFVCVKGSQQRGNKTGFVTNFTKEEKQKFDSTKTVVDVPAGHIILFYQHIVHMVRKYVIKQRELRLFLGVRFTNSATSMFDYDQAIIEQGVPMIPSGQIPRLYEKMHAANHQDKITKWAEIFIPQMKVTPTSKNKTILPATSKSLLVLGEESQKNLLYPDYNEYDLAVLKPTPLSGFL